MSSREDAREPPELAAARRHLARAEADLLSPDALTELDAGLALLEDVAEAEPPGYADVARNLAASYLARLHERIRAKAGDPALPEPECEHLFRMLVAFDASAAAKPQGVDETKIRLARGLIDRYYEGHSPEAKAKAVEELTRLSKSARA